MDRRLFLTTLAAGAVSGGVARAEIGLRSRLDVLPNGDSYPVIVNRDGVAVRINHVVVTDGARALSVDWTGGAALYNEDRANLSGAGALGSLFRTPFRVRWREAQPMGAVELVPGAHLLVARVQDLSAMAGAGVTLGAGRFAWDLPGRLSQGGTPAQGQAAGGVRLGRDGRVLVMLPQMVAQF